MTLVETSVVAFALGIRAPGVRALGMRGTLTRYRRPGRKETLYDLAEVIDLQKRRDADAGGICT